MPKSRLIASGLTVVALLLSMSVTRATAQNDKLVGAWKVTLATFPRKIARSECAYQSLETRTSA
jgi:hypothetical protein